MLKKKSKKNKIIFRVIFSLIFISLSWGLGIALATANSVINIINDSSDEKFSITSISDIKKAVNTIQEIRNPLEETLNILVMGSDISYYRGKVIEDAPTRTDTMIFVNINPSKKQINMLSIPRDTRILIPGKNYYDKINSAYAIGGEQLARQVVSNLVGMPIHHYVILKVNALINIIDILGGIEIDVEKDMKYKDDTAKLYIDLKKGKQLLDGKKAHAYVRFRHDEIGDIGRVQRQQKFINALTLKLMNPTIFTKIPELVKEVKKNLITDMSYSKMLKIAYFAKNLERENIKMVMLPGEFYNRHGISYWKIDEYNFKELINERFPESIYADKNIDNINNFSDIEKRKYKITVLNGSDIPRLAAKTSRYLRDNGWIVWSVGESKEKVNKTKIIIQTGKEKPAQFLKNDLQIPVELVNASIGDLYTDYTIIVGKDFSDYLISKQEQIIDVSSNKLRKN
ncbi:MAG: hypothetical protein KatS3mg068_1145 [Candidatus Sericytochromatia bacterium]|nr:MAG: hypothetical protein KatS3mg068_1145 [Candidatus Sericytochromatia bacterium]